MTFSELSFVFHESSSELRIHITVAPHKASIQLKFCKASDSLIEAIPVTSFSEFSRDPEANSITI